MHPFFVLVQCKFDCSTCGLGATVSVPLSRIPRTIRCVIGLKLFNTPHVKLLWKVVNQVTGSCAYYCRMWPYFSNCISGLWHGHARIKSNTWWQYLHRIASATVCRLCSSFQSCVAHHLACVHACSRECCSVVMQSCMQYTFWNLASTCGFQRCLSWFPWRKLNMFNSLVHHVTYIVRSWNADDIWQVMHLHDRWL